MTRSIAESQPHHPTHFREFQRLGPLRRPALRRLADVVPPPPCRDHPSPQQAHAARTAPGSGMAVQPGPVATDPVSRVLHAAVEVLDGRRPAAQLARVLRPDLLAHLVTLQGLVGELRPRVRKVVTRRQGCATLEAVVLLSLNTGVRALAARFERPPGSDSRWSCTALELRLTAGDLRTVHTTTTRPFDTRR